MASMLIIPILEYIIVLILIGIPPSYLSSDDAYRGCSNLIKCGNIAEIGFPFWGDNRPNWCGHPELQLSCQKNMSYITIKDVQYQVLEANPVEHTLRIARVDYFNGLCPSKLVSTTLDTHLFVYGSDYKNLTLSYSCTPSFNFPSHQCPNAPSDGQYIYPQFGSLPPPIFCKQSVVLPVSPSLINITDFFQIQKAIRDGFVVRWILGIQYCDKCQKSNGVCGYDWNLHQTTCSNSLPDDKTPPPSQHPLLPGHHFSET
ncbi:hypothetical protein VNO77_21651 [Canavalia gladiata]|uniref:non-specific serine/threonine protein kinase n=1 Tax=Canavalia gladiata TaxID=3824 RepID=A0AAN9LVP7_CANGL